jgi:hypothetical protein
LPDVRGAKFVAMMRAFHEFILAAALDSRQPPLRFAAKAMSAP